MEDEGAFKAPPLETPEHDVAEWPLDGEGPALARLLSGRGQRQRPGLEWELTVTTPDRVFACCVRTNDGPMAILVAVRKLLASA